MDAVTEALSHMLKLQDEDQAREEAIEAEYTEILKSREQTVEAMRAWVDQLDTDEALQKLAELIAHGYAAYSGGSETTKWWQDLHAESRKYVNNAGIQALTAAAESNLARRKEISEQDAADAMQPWEEEP